MKKAFFFFIFLLGLDFASKWAALEWIPPLSSPSYPFGGIPLFSLSGITFSLNYTVNTGAAWGFFQGHSGLLFGLRSLIVLGLIVYLVFFHKGRSPSFPLWLIVTGAIGNIVDYALYGHVIDFLHFTFWGYSFPVFNMADSCITLGVLSLLLMPQLKKRSLHPL